MIIIAIKRSYLVLIIMSIIQNKIVFPALLAADKISIYGKHLMPLKKDLRSKSELSP